MTLTERFRNLFKSPTNEAEPINPSIVEAPRLTTSAAGPVLLPSIPGDFPTPSANESTLVTEAIPAWLEDEELLRDEAVLFGLSDARAEEKVALIRHYFSHRTADLELTVERFNEKIGELNLFIEQKENRIGELEHKRSELEQKRPAEHHLPRTLVGLGLSITMCVGNYFLIAETIRPSFPTNASLISIGVFLAGMFNLFGRISLFHDTETVATPRRLLEEIGLPLAASFFVLVQALQQQQPVLNAMALFVFVFFLFLLAGKLLLGNLTVLHRDLRTYTANQQLKHEQNAKLPGWEAEAEQLKREIDDIRAQKWQLMPDLNRAEANLGRLNARRDMLVNLFMSEFNLARKLKERLGNNVKNILSEKP